MPRQRLRLRRRLFASLVLRALVSVLGLALIYYGAMTILLALKLSPHTVNDLSAYRTIYHRLSTITAHDITGQTRLIVAIAGCVCFAVCAPLAWRSLPRPYLARRGLRLNEAGGRGSTIVDARAIERAAEIAAREHALVTAARGRYETDGVHLAVDVKRAQAVPATLRAVQERVIRALARHELTDIPVQVTMTGFHRQNRRELR